MTISSDEIEKLEVRYEGDSYDCEALAGYSRVQKRIENSPVM